MIEKTYQLSLKQDDINHLTSFLYTHGFILVEDDIFHHQYIYANQSYEDQLADHTYHIYLRIKVIQSDIKIEVEVKDEKTIPLTLRPYLKLLMKTCYSVIKDSDERKKDWESYHKKIKNRKTLGGSIKTILNVLEVVGNIID